MAGTSMRELGELLGRLKDRDGRSYSALARRVGASRSSLHRYCQGRCVPETFDTVERLARLCKASPEELAELRRLWTPAVAQSTAPCPGTASPAAPDRSSVRQQVPAPVRRRRQGQSESGRSRWPAVLLAVLAAHLLLAAVVAGFPERTAKQLRGLLRRAGSAADREAQGLPERPPV